MAIGVIIILLVVGTAVGLLLGCLDFQRSKNDPPSGGPPFPL